MTRDNRPLGEVLPFGKPRDLREEMMDCYQFGNIPPKDHSQGVRYIRPHDLARLNGEPVDLYQQLQSSQGRPDGLNGLRSQTGGGKSATIREIIRHAWAEFRDFMLDNPRIGYPIVAVFGFLAGLVALWGGAELWMVLQ